MFPVNCVEYVYDDIVSPITGLSLPLSDAICKFSNCLQMFRRYVATTNKEINENIHIHPDSKLQFKRVSTDLTCKYISSHHLRVYLWCDTCTLTFTSPTVWEKIKTNKKQWCDEIWFTHTTWYTNNGVIFFFTGIGGRFVFLLLWIRGIHQKILAPVNASVLVGDEDWDCLEDELTDDKMNQLDKYNVNRIYKVHNNDHFHIEANKKHMKVAQKNDFFLKLCISCHLIMLANLRVLKAYSCNGRVFGDTRVLACAMKPSTNYCGTKLRTLYLEILNSMAKTQFPILYEQDVINFYEVCLFV